MTPLRLAAAAGLAAIALAGCERNDETSPGAVPPKTAAPAGPLAATDLPTPSPGLWENKVQVAQAEAGPTTRICYDKAFAERIGVMGQSMSAGVDCQPTMTRQIDGSLAFTASCTGPDGKASSSKGVIRGDFTKAYTIETTSADNPAGAVTISAVRVGDCPADYKPGDVDVQGVRMNLASVMAGADASKSAPAP